jgi:gamma-glutamyltranspeptidase / glutathione hydrolase
VALLSAPIAESSRPTALLQEYPLAEDLPMRNFQTPGRSAVYACNGLAATSHPLATKVALNALEAGGNAVDAALAAALVLPLCEPQSSGLFGDVFALVKPAGSHGILGLNGSGPAPLGLSAEALRSEGLSGVPTNDARAVTLPGAVAAFERLSLDHGRLGLAAAAAPAIRYAEEGVPVAPRVAFDWAAAAANLQGAARGFYLFDGKPPEPGQCFRAPGQAEVLRRIAADGAKGFYEGDVAADLCASLQALGGSHTLDDFAAVTAEPVEPLSTLYRGFELVELPPNGQGATALLMAKIMGHFALGNLDPQGVERAHLEAEAAKLAYDVRDRFIADPRREPSALGRLLGDDSAAALAGLIDPARAMADPVPLTAAVHRDTVYLSVVDRERCAVSLIFSIFHSFGSGLASERFGLIFQNRGAGFTLTPGHPNEAAGGKRPLHTIIPAMLRRNGRPVMPFGVMGGQYQPTGHMRILSNLVDFGMDLQSAIDASRSFPGPGGLVLETGYSPATAAGLERLGHRVVWADSPLGGAQAIWIDDDRGVLIGASDPRKDGCALGY